MVQIAKKMIKAQTMLGVLMATAIMSGGSAEAKWWHRTASKAGKFEGIEQIKIGGRVTPVAVRGKDQPIDCPEGFWQSNSRHVPFCVNKSHSTYKDTPLCLISLHCRELQLSDYRIPLLLNSETLEKNWQHYANAVNVGHVEERDLLALGDVWPGMNRISSTWGQVASLLCEANQCQQLIVKIPTLTNLVATLNFGGIGIQTNLPSIADMMGSVQPVTLGKLPADWFSKQRLTEVINKFQLWNQSIEEVGISQPTTGQVGLTYGQFLIVQSSGAGAGLNGKMQFFYDNRRPSDNTSLGQGAGQEQIITGSNRFIKSKCTVKSGSGRAYNNCANIVVRQNASAQGSYQRFVLVTAHEEKLTGLGGGDVILANTAVGSVDYHSGDFRKPEIVGGTNDEPLLPSANSVEIGLQLDQCTPQPPTMAPLIHTNTLVPAYQSPSSLCPNLFRKSNLTYKKQIFLFSQDGADHLEAFANRICSLRQLYRLKTDGRRIVAVPDITITACEGIPQTPQAQGKRLTGQNVIHVFLRGGLLAKPE